LRTRKKKPTDLGEKEISFFFNKSIKKIWGKYFSKRIFFPVLSKERVRTFYAFSEKFYFMFFLNKKISNSDLQIILEIFF